MALQEARDLATPELHSMFGLRRRRPRAAAVTEFSAALKKLGFPQNRVAKLFGVSCRHIRRWQHGDRTVPRAVRLVINLLVAGAILIDQVEQAADPVPTQTNGVKPEPPARLRDEPEPKLPASLRVEPAPAPAEAAAARTPVKINGDAGPGAPAPRRVAPAPELAVIDRDQTLAEKVLALGDACCRFPIGDPRCQGFFFCSRPTAAQQPYCKDHTRAAYEVPQTRHGRTPSRFSAQY